MLHLIAVVEILVYLFFAPLLRTSVDRRLDEYSFGIAFLFLVFFLMGGLLARVGGAARARCPRNTLLIPELNNPKWFLIIAWMWAVITIAISFDLYNRRIGTAAAADLFAGIPVYYLLIFRSLEVAIPVLLSLVVVDVVSRGTLKFNVAIIACSLVGVIFAVGAGSSRSWVGLIFIMVLILIKNKLPTKVFRNLIVVSVLMSILVFFVVTFFRINSGDDRLLSEYVSEEVLRRVDGLEVVSRVIDSYGYQMFGINERSILNPLLSAIPFLDISTELKAKALTTVKSVILEEEFQSSFQDVNSFALLDAYYWGGLFCVIIVAFIFGFFSKLVDLMIGVTSGWIYQLFLVSLVGNLVILERETIGIFMSVLRDWFLLCVIAVVFLARVRSPRNEGVSISGFKK